MASSKDLPGTVTSELPGQLGKFVPFTGAIVNIMMILMMIRDVGIRGHCLEYKLIFDTVLLCLRYIRFILSHHITETHINIYAHTLYHASEARPSPSLSTGHPPGCFVFPGMAWTWGVPRVPPEGDLVENRRLERKWQHDGNTSCFSNVKNGNMPS